MNTVNFRVVCSVSITTTFHIFNSNQSFKSGSG